MIVDATGQVLGRLSAYIAKKALLGEEVIVVNAEKAVISGRRENILRECFEKLDIRNKGNYTLGPFHYKRPDKFVRMAIRGMLPWHRLRGREAYKRVMVYIGVPGDEVKRKYDIDLSKVKIQSPSKSKKRVAGVTVGEVCSSIGGKW